MFSGVFKESVIYLILIDIALKTREKVWSCGGRACVTFLALPLLEESV